MQNPEAILAAAKGGGVPATWHVLRPTRGYPAGAGCLGAFVMFFLLFAGTLVSFGVVAVNAVSDPASFFASILPVPLPGLIGLGVGAIIVVGLLSAMRAISRIPYSYFVFTPEGAVQATGPKQIIAIDYAAIDLINTRVQVNSYTTTNQSTGVRTTNSTVSVWGELHYSDGRTVRFRPASRFGSAESIIQRLINGHREYTAMVGVQRPSRAAQ